MPPVSESDYLRALCRIGARWKHKRTREVETVTGVDGQYVETDKHRLLIKELLHKGLCMATVAHARRSGMHPDDMRKMFDIVASAPTRRKAGQS